MFIVVSNNFIVVSNNFIVLSWRSSFIYLAFLRFCWLLLRGDQRKQL